MEFNNILFTVEAGVARLTLNRPDKLNSFTGEMHAELRVALDSIQADKTVRVLVLTGAGRAFCAGQDLADPDMQKVDGKMPDIGNVVEANYKPLVLRLQNLRVPTIAAVNGIAAGAGASVALACDLVVASKSASFLQAFSKIGLVPDTGGTWFLPQRVGMARAMGLALLADKLPAEKAADWGLIWEAVADDAFAARIDTLAQQLAAMPTKALVRTRQAMHAAPGHTLEQQLSFEGSFMRELGWSPDYAEGVAAFMEKRAPKFTGELAWPNFPTTPSTRPPSSRWSAPARWAPALPRSRRRATWSSCSTPGPRPRPRRPPASAPSLASWWRRAAWPPTPPRRPVRGCARSSAWKIWPTPRW